jgi:hypothetical protein
MRRIAGLLALTTIGLAASAAAPTWPGRLDITVALPAPSTAGATDLMVCVVDPDGHGRCHHRDGVVPAKVASPRAATCAGAEAPLRPACAGPGPCVLTGVPVPTGPFGLLVLSIRPPAFGVPRHAIADAAILTRGAGTGTAPEHGRITGALAAIARCLAPSDAHRLRADPPVVAIRACAARACDLGHVSLRFAARARASLTDH